MNCSSNHLKTSLNAGNQDAEPNHFEEWAKFLPRTGLALDAKVGWLVKERRDRAVFDFTILGSSGCAMMFDHKCSQHDHDKRKFLVQSKCNRKYR